MKAVLQGEQSGDDINHPFLRGKLQRPSERRLNGSGPSVAVLDRIIVPCGQVEVLDERERVDEVKNLRKWKVNVGQTEGFERG